MSLVGAAVPGCVAPGSFSEKTTTSRADLRHEGPTSVVFPRTLKTGATPCLNEFGGWAAWSVHWRLLQGTSIECSKTGLFVHFGRPARLEGVAGTLERGAHRAGNHRPLTC